MHFVTKYLYIPRDYFRCKKGNGESLRFVDYAVGEWQVITTIQTFPLPIF